jgi:hypothetical protein
VFGQRQLGPEYLNAAEELFLRAHERNPENGRKERLGRRVENDVVARKVLAGLIRNDARDAVLTAELRPRLECRTDADHRLSGWPAERLSLAGMMQSRSIQLGLP